MILKTIILGLLIALSIPTAAQEYTFVGMTKEEVSDIVRSDHRDFTRDNSVVKQQFNYFKYVNGSQTITWIFYFSEDDICTATKKVCDYSEYDFVIRDLDKKFNKVKSNVWEFTLDGEDYSLTLEEKDWYFTLRESEKDNR